MNSESPLHKRIAYYGKKQELEIYYSCQETQADGEVNVDVLSVTRANPAAQGPGIDSFDALDQFISFNDLTWEQVIANAPLVTDEDGETIRRK